MLSLVHFLFFFLTNRLIPATKSMSHLNSFYVSCIFSFSYFLIGWRHQPTLHGQFFSQCFEKGSTHWIVLLKKLIEFVPAFWVFRIRSICHYTLSSDLLFTNHFDYGFDRIKNKIKVREITFFKCWKYLQSSWKAEENPLVKAEMFEAHHWVLTAVHVYSFLL